MITSRQLGMYGFQEIAGLGTAYPDLRDQVNALVNSRIASIPWAPSDLGAVLRSAQDERQDWVIAPLPAYGGNGRINSSTPAWIDTEAKRQAWTQMATQVQTQVMAYGAGAQRDAAAALQQLQDNAAFWNKVADATAKTGDSIAAGFKTGAIVVVVVGAAALLGLWFWKDPAGFKNFFGKLIPGKR